MKSTGLILPASASILIGLAFNKLPEEAIKQIHNYIASVYTGCQPPDWDPRIHQCPNRLGGVGFGHFSIQSDTIFLDTLPDRHPAHTHHSCGFGLIAADLTQRIDQLDSLFLP